MMIDVPVNHLNSRLALQLPPELPLGLVFVVGHVESLRQTGNDISNIRTKFELVEKDHRIQCELSERAAEESSLTEGARVRAGGHLAFDSHRARYFLLARDIEMVSSPPIKLAESPEPQTNGNGIHKALGRQALTPVLADIKRRSETSNLEEAQLPYWVKKLAPAEVKKELGQLEARETARPLSPPPSPLDDKLLSTLSQAMDSDEEVELTPEMLAELTPTAVLPPPSPVKNDPYQIPSAPPSPSSNQQNLTVAVTILIFAFILLAILLIYLFAGI